MTDAHVEPLLGVYVLDAPRAGGKAEVVSRLGRSGVCRAACPEVADAAAAAAGRPGGGR
ncbi:zf-HC2 domain-containing protein [Streptomyces agglomeratus]|uniref:zf-HC2 domain-containing protein n=1 Tax=Streptomyces agglomeratus TaxID=285458 RepID=UPI00114C9F80|nr:zf-HC2 domain-containing protein [Streptomyces agglomeratus]